MPSRCVFGCKPNGTEVRSLHRFPNFKRHPEQFKAWVQLVGGKLEYPSDYEYYNRNRICDIHFLDSDRNRNKRLNALAVPSLHLPGQPEHQKLFKQEEASSSMMILPSTSEQAFTGTPMQQVLFKKEASSSVMNQPSSSEQAITGSVRSTTAAKSVLLEHNYFVINKPNKIFRRDTCKKMLMGPFYNNIKRLQVEISRLHKKGQSFRERLHKANELSDSTNFQYVVKNMTKPAQLFMHMQQATKKSKRRRFTVEEKVPSLSLFKKSPTCYELLFKYFTLPSAKSV